MSQPDSVPLIFTNLGDATEHLQHAGDEAADREIYAHHKMMSEAVASCGGRELEWIDDGILASYPSAANAVYSAVLIQQTAQRRTSGVRVLE